MQFGFLLRRYLLTLWTVFALNVTIGAYYYMGIPQRPKNVVSVISWSMWYQAQFSFWVCLLLSIHCTLPIETIFPTYGIYCVDCFVWHQSASNKSQAACFLLTIFSIRACRVFLSQGGLVIIKPLHSRGLSNKSRILIRSALSSISLVLIHLWPCSYRLLINSFLHVHGSINSVFLDKWRINGMTAL